MRVPKKDGREEMVMDANRKAPVHPSEVLLGPVAGMIGGSDPGEGELHPAELRPETRGPQKDRVRFG